MNKYEMFKNVGIKIKKEREKKKLTLKEISNKAGINIKYLKRIELGSAFGIRISHILNIAFAMKIEPYVFFENLE